MKPKVYIETSVPSYLAARRSQDVRVLANEETTTEWWESRRPHFACSFRNLCWQKPRWVARPQLERDLRFLKALPGWMRRMVLVHPGILKSIYGLLCFAPFFYASAIAHSALRDQPWRRRPRPNENCPLRIRCASSMPAIVIAAFANDLNPAIDAQRRLIARDGAIEIMSLGFDRDVSFVDAPRGANAG